MILLDLLLLECPSNLYRKRSAVFHFLESLTSVGNFYIAVLHYLPLNYCSYEYEGIFQGYSTLPITPTRQMEQSIILLFSPNDQLPQQHYNALELHLASVTIQIKCKGYFLKK